MMQLNKLQYRLVKVYVEDICPWLLPKLAPAEQLFEMGDRGRIVTEITINNQAISDTIYHALEGANDGILKLLRKDYEQRTLNIGAGLTSAECVV